MADARVVVAGNLGAVLQKCEPYFDPRDGWLTSYTYVGIKSAIYAQANLMASTGYRVNITHRGPNYTLQAVVPTVEGEQPVYTWEILTSWREEDLWVNPKISGLFTTYGALADARNKIEGDIRDKTLEKDLGDWSADPNLKAIWGLLRMGISVCKVRKPVLRRRRTIPPDWTSPVVIDAVEKVWTWAGLVKAFDVPPLIAARIPGGESSPLPTPPLGFTYAYMEMTAESNILFLYNKTEETQEWEFGAVTSMLYDIIDH